MLTLINKLLKRNKTKKVDGKVVDNKIPSTLNSVIELIWKLKNIEIDTFKTSRPLFEGDLYNTFVLYLDAHRNGAKLPKGKDIEEELGITAFKRKELSKKAFEDEILMKGQNGYYIWKI
jgi:hypothetical protein